MTDKKLTLEDVSLDIPDADTSGFLDRNLATIDHQIAMVEAAEGVENAQSNIERLQKGAKNLTGAQQKKAYAQLRAALETYKTAISKTVDYIVMYVDQPEDKSEARAVIRGLSENQYNQVLEYIRNGGAPEVEDSAENPPA